MKNLEQKIQEERALFDRIEEAPVQDLWDRIQPAIEPTEERPSGWSIQLGRNWQWSIAAAIALAIGCAVWLYQPTKSPETRDNLELIVQYFPELAAEGKQYQQLIAQKESELGLSKLDRQLYQDVFQELDLLEAINKEYLKDIPLHGEKELLIEALTRYYERKLRILERLSNEVDKQNHHESLPREI